MTTTKAYDKINRLTSINHANGANTLASYAYGYNAANQRTNVTFADDSFWTFGYDSLGQVNSGKRRSSSGNLFAGLQYEYEFDDIGNRSLTRSGGDTNGAGLRTANYSPNLLNQYTSRDIPPYVEVHGEAATNATVTVNNLPTARRGKRFRAEVPADNSAGMISQSLTNIAVLKNAGPASQDIVDTQTGSVLVPASPEAFTYDLDGNTLADGRWTNTWNGENRLIQIESHASVPDEHKRKLVFSYDSQGRRISKDLYTWNTSTLNYDLSTQTKFLYDGWNLIAELTPTNTLIRSYQWGLDLSGTGQGAGGVRGVLFLTDHSDTTTHAYAHDGNGNVTTLANAADSTITASYEYSPFGQVIKAAGPKAIINPIRFSTKYEDDATELVYYGLRFYKPDTGRWLNRDPIMESGNLNIFAFPFNDPQGGVDILGLFSASINGPEEIIALDKNFPSSDFHVYSSNDPGPHYWTAHGKLQIIGSNTGSFVLVYATGESTHKKDSMLTAGTRCRIALKRVTVRRPKYLRRPNDLTAYVRWWLGLYVWKVDSYKWRVTDQFDDALAGVPVSEDVWTYDSQFALGSQQTGNTTSDSNGEFTDIHVATFFHKQGWRSFGQKIIIGNWEADNEGYQEATGTFQYNSFSIFE